MFGCQFLDLAQNRGRCVVDLDVLVGDVGRAACVGTVPDAAGKFRQRRSGDLFDGGLVFADRPSQMSSFMTMNQDVL